MSKTTGAGLHVAYFMSEPQVCMVCVAFLMLITYTELKLITGKQCSYNITFMSITFKITT